MYLYLRSHHYIALAVLDLRDLPVCLTSAGIKDLCYHGEPRNGEFLIGEWVAENTQYILHFKICLHWGMVAHTIFALVRWRQRNLGLKGQPRATLGYLVSNTHLHMFFLMTKQTRDEQKDLTIRCWDWQVNHHVCKSISINNRFAVQLTLQTAKIHSAWNAISETDPPLHAWLTDYSASEATSISSTHRTSHNYLTSMVSTHHAKCLLTFSTPSLDVSVKLLSIVTLEFCLNTALLQTLSIQHRSSSVRSTLWQLCRLLRDC